MYSHAEFVEHVTLGVMRLPNVSPEIPKGYARMDYHIYDLSGKSIASLALYGLGDTSYPPQADPLQVYPWLNHFATGKTWDEYLRHYGGFERVSVGILCDLILLYAPDTLPDDFNFHDFIFWRLLGSI